MSLPRSRIIGCAPACASISPANIPAGPKPTTIGRNCELLLFAGKSYLYGLTVITLFDLHFTTICSSSSDIATSTLYVKCTSSLRLASTLFLKIVRLVIYFSFIFKTFAAFDLRRASLSSSDSLISLILIIFLFVLAWLLCLLRRLYRCILHM